MRFATIQDKDKIIDLLKQFAIKSQYPMSHEPMMWSRSYIDLVLNAIINGRGFVLIEDESNSILIAVKTPSFWVPNYIQLQEVMLYSESKKSSVKLIREYAKLAKKMILQGDIHEAVIACNTDANLAKYGMVKFENNWRVK